MSFNLYFLFIIIFILFSTVVLPLILIKKNSKGHNKKGCYKYHNDCDECEYGANEVKLNHKKLLKKERLK